MKMSEKIAKNGLQLLVIFANGLGWVSTVTPSCKSGFELDLDKKIEFFFLFLENVEIFKNKDFFCGKIPILFLRSVFVAKS